MEEVIFAHILIGKSTQGSTQKDNIKKSHHLNTIVFNNVITQVTK